MRLEWIANQTGKTIRQTLQQHFGCSRRQLIRLKNQPGSVRVNGRPMLLNAVPGPGDRVTVELAEHLGHVPPQSIPLTVIYEDEHIIVVNKPAGMVVHPTKGYSYGTLANALASHLGRPARLVTRLDRETSGLVLAAKQAWSHHRLNNARINREYLAITQGIPDPLEGEIDAPLGRDQAIPGRRGVDCEGKPAFTRYRTESTAQGFALVRLWPQTGRTHQLRIHMSHIGCPLVDDFMYGTVEGFVGRTALHSARLEFPHPLTGEDRELSAPAPADMADLIKRMEWECKRPSLGGEGR